RELLPVRRVYALAEVDPISDTRRAIKSDSIRTAALRGHDLGCWLRIGDAHIDRAGNTGAQVIGYVVGEGVGIRYSLGRDIMNPTATARDAGSTGTLRIHRLQC